MLLDLRKKTAESPDDNQRSAPQSERIIAKLYARLMSSPGLLRSAIRFGRILQSLGKFAPFSPLTKDGNWIRKAPLPLLSKWTRSRDLPTLPKQTFHELWEQGIADGPRDE